MSGNKIGFNEITGIEFNGDYGGSLNDRLKAINDNFHKIANADYMKGVDGDDVRVLNASFANGDNGSPLSEGVLYYDGDGGEKITKWSLYTSILNCIAGLIGNAGGDGAINGINWYDGLLENNSIMIIADEENGNYYLKSSLYFVYNDPRFANPTEDTNYGGLKNLSCVVTYDGLNWVASQPFPKIYYSTEVNDFCWEINGQGTGLIARGPKGPDGQNYPLWLCRSNSIIDIKQTNNDQIISITIDGIYRFDGTNYNYITPSNHLWDAIITSGEFKNNMALCIVPIKDKNEENREIEITKLYCGYLYWQDGQNGQPGKLRIYTTQNSAIDTIIGRETLYSLLKSNFADNKAGNSLFIPAESIDAGGSLSRKQIYSIYGLNETVEETDSNGDKTKLTYRTFNMGVSVVSKDDGKTLTPQYGYTKLNLWSNEINLKTGGDNTLQITPGRINIYGNLISDNFNNGKPRRYVQMMLPESYLTFESYIQRNLSDSLSPIDAAMNPEACANRLSFYNPDLVDIEYSKYDKKGETFTWEDCFDNSNDAYKIKTKLLTTGFKDILSNLHLGKKFDAKGDLTFTNKDKLRVSIYIRPGEFYGKLDKLNLYTTFRPVKVKPAQGEAELKMNCKIYLYKITDTVRIKRKDFDTDIKKYYNGEKTWEGLDVSGNQTIQITNPWVITTSEGKVAENAKPTHIHENLSGEPGWNSIALHDSNMIGSYDSPTYPEHYSFTAGRVYKIVLEFGLEGNNAYQNTNGDWVNTSKVARLGGIRLFGSKWYVVKDKNGNTNPLAGYNSICSWDENGAAVFPAGVSNQFKITYEKLKDLANNDKLVPGTKYRIIDYKPKFNGTDIKSGEHQFDIIVEAVDNKTLSENANAVLHDGDEYFKNSKLNKWELKYSLNTSGFDWVDDDDPGVIYYMKDEFDNEASYDFKNVMYVLNISNDDPSPRNHIIYSLLDKYKKNIITKYLTDHSGQFDQNLSTWIQKGSQITLTYDCPCLFYTFSSIYIDNLNIISADESNISCSFDVKTKDYSFTEFCYNNVLGKNSLYNIFIAAIEQSGTSYVTKNNKLDINCTNNIFGEKCRNNIFGEKCIGNNFVGYCEDNCFENFCSRNNCDEYFKGNKLGDHIEDNVFGKNYVHNIIKSYLIKSTFGNNCNNNTFGIEVSITSTSNNNTNYNFKGITFGDNCSNNNLGQRCYDITFGDNCSNNNLGQESRYIIFNKYCSNNNLGSNNSTIKTSSNSRITNCMIGNGCMNILFISPLTCKMDTNTHTVIYDPMPMFVEGAKIGNKCKGLIISISKRITDGVSFLLYNTDSDNNYAKDYLEETLSPRRILSDVRLTGICEIEGLNIYSNTDRYHVDKTDIVSEHTMLVLTNLYNLKIYNTESWSMDDLDKVFIDGCMMELSDWLGGGQNVFMVLSCKPLIVDKSVGIFHMCCQTSATKNSSKKQTITSEWK